MIKVNFNFQGNHALGGLKYRVLQGLFVLPSCCIRTSSLLWVPFMLVVCFYSLAFLPFAGDDKYIGWWVSPRTLSVWQCLVVADLRVAMDTYMFCLRLISCTAPPSLRHLCQAHQLATSFGLLIVDWFQHIKIQPKTTGLSLRLWGVTTEFERMWGSVYSPEPRAEVYCFRLNFNSSKLV